MVPFFKTPLARASPQQGTAKRILLISGTVSRELCILCKRAAVCFRQQVFSEAGDSDAVAWMRQLEDEEGVAPLWEVFFQIAAYPVPQVDA